MSTSLPPLEEEGVAPAALVVVWAAECFLSKFGHLSANNVDMRQVIIVFLGAGLGGALRHLINLGITRAVGTVFPVGILAVNIIGCFYF